MNALQQVLFAKAAFAKPENIIRGIPLELATVRPHGLPHSLYEELWHIRYWLRFSWALIQGEQPVIPAHSTEAFPGNSSTLSDAEWQKLVGEVLESLEMVMDFAGNEANLSRKFRPDRTIGEELTVVAAHNAYHFGRMVMLRQLLGIWSLELGDTW